MELNLFQDKSERDDRSSAESGAARRIARRFDSQGERGLEAIVAELMKDAEAGKILQQLNRQDRPDVVRAVAQAAGVDAKTGAAFAVEAARAFARAGERQRAADILRGHAATRRRDYNFQYAAGRVFSEMRLHGDALAAFKAALSAKPTQLAAERTFAAHLALEQYDEAAALAGRLIRAGTLRDSLARDLAYLLRHLPTGRLDPDLAEALSTLEGGESRLVPALMPHLIASDQAASVRATVERGLAAATGWDFATLAKVLPYLASRKETELLLRMRDQASSETAPLFQEVLEAIPQEALDACAAPVLEGLAPTCGDRLAALTQAAALLAGSKGRQLYTREKHRIARLAANASADHPPKAAEAIAKLVMQLLPQSVRDFYAGSVARELAEAIGQARREAAAPEGSRLARLREDYFAFQLERRRGLPPEAIESDVSFCEAAFDYFADLSEFRPAIQVSIGSIARERLGRPALMLSHGVALDTLGAWALIQSRPQISLNEPERFEEFLRWYLEGVLLKRSLPPACIAPGIEAYLNHVVLADGRGGVSLTRFLQAAWTRAPENRRRFDLGNAIDRILFVLELGAELLPGVNEYLPFFAPHLRAPLVAATLDALGAGVLASALSAEPRAAAPARAEAGVQDVLLVGHAGRETGLGRNFAMLGRGLAAAGVALTTLDFAAAGDVISGTAERWYRERRSDPIVVLAVNAEDAPDVFVKDRSNSLAQCYAAGFFLWEMSAIPAIQRLGVELMDEIWAPTRYVADIYAPFKPAHVVGKGLFTGGEPFLQTPIKRAPNKPFRFVTVFDFDSSIERKNPLAAVLAFQQAFGRAEDVELVVKTSNVDPRHWSNAWGQWERLTAQTRDDPRIQLVGERYSNDEMIALVRGADCIVSLHRSEGFGYLMADAMAFGVPVIASGYSGNADFCDAETSYPVDFRLVDAPDGAARWRCTGAQWAEPDVAHAAAQLRAVRADYAAALAKAALARARIADRYSLKAFQDSLAARLRAIAALPRRHHGV
ncbi:MAG: glycosyltransferase [Alphaproteobacteria bacterium]|nr:glycosyltransferase [Alphaproteobacteria bacterium]